MINREMKRHRSYEFYAAKYLNELGYQTDVTNAVGDWGVDVFATRCGIRYAVQVKMYGASKTKISRKDIMELYGAMAYFDCQAAMVMYNGKVNDDTWQVAKKLNIEMVYLDYSKMEEEIPEEEQMNDEVHSLHHIWMNYVKPLAYQKIRNRQGLSYEIGEVTDGYIEVYSQQHRKNRIKVDEFKWIIDRVKHYGEAYAIDLRNELKSTHSSMVTLICDNIPVFEVTYNPRKIAFSDGLMREGEEQKEVHEEC